MLSSRRVFARLPTLSRVPVFSPLAAHAHAWPACSFTTTTAAAVTGTPPGHPQPPQSHNPSEPSDPTQLYGVKPSTSRAPPPASSPPPPAAGGVGAGAGVGAAPPASAASGAGGAQESAVFHVTAASFESAVMKSATPVMLDVYADWCGPCKQLTPALESIARNSGGRLRLAKLDSDAEPQLSQALQVRSLPSVFGLAGGQLVDSFVGVPAEDRLKEFVSKLMSAGGAPSTPLSVATADIADAKALASAGRGEDALDRVTSALQVLAADNSAAAMEVKAAGVAVALRVNVEARDRQAVDGLVTQLKTVFGNYLTLPDVSQALAMVQLMPADDAPPAAPADAGSVMDVDPEDPQAL